MIGLNKATRKAFLPLYEFMGKKYDTKAEAIEAACEFAIGKTKDVLVYCVREIRYHNAEGIMIKQSIERTLAVKVVARPTKAQGGWVDYEE